MKAFYNNEKSNNITTWYYGYKILNVLGTFKKFFYWNLSIEAKINFDKIVEVFS